MTVNGKNVRGGLPEGFPPPTSEDGRAERLPAAGNGNGSSLNNSGSNGNYWSSTPNPDNPDNARNLNFNSDNFDWNNNNRNNGQSVRPLRALASDSPDGVSHLASSGDGFNAEAQRRREVALLADLIAAYRDARRHKRAKGYQLRFEMNWERELVRLRDELLARTYEPRPSSCFIIHDPKMREVFAAEFRDRVVHHLFYNYTHDIFERTFIADSYSCIEGRGTHYGIARLKKHILSCSQNWSKPCFVLKIDIKGYFMSIDRARLLARCRKILGRAALCRGPGGDGAPPSRDWTLVDYLLEKICLLDPLVNCRVIGDSSEWNKLPEEKSLFNSKPGCGLPIGNLSSQLFSNVYMGAFDDFVKRELKCRHYGRYVDDAFVAGNSKNELKALLPRMREFLRDELGLALNERKTEIRDARHGVEFLGAFVKPYRAYPAARTLRRIGRRMAFVDWREGAARCQARVNSMLGVLSHYDCYFQRKILVWRTGLHGMGEVSGDCLRFYPDMLALNLKGTRR